MLTQQIGDQARQAEHAGENAGQQDQQKGCVGGLPGGDDAATQQHQRCGGHAGDGAQQFIVDTTDKRHCAAGYTWHHIGRPHGDALDKEQNVLVHGFLNSRQIRPKAH